MRIPFAPLVLVAAAVVAGGCQMRLPLVERTPEAPPFPAGWSVMDLTRPLDANAPYVKHAQAFPFERLEFDEPRTRGWRTGAYSGLEHMGTHVAAPYARLPVGATIDRIGASQLMLPLVVIDAPTRGESAVSVSMIEAEERARGPIPPGAAVVLRTGRAITAQDADGRPSFPGWGEDAVRLLALSRGVRAIGTDALAIDASRNMDAAPAQAAGSAANLWFIVGLADLSRVPVRGATLIVGVVPIVGAAGAPARVLALIPPADPRP